MSDVVTVGEIRGRLTLDDSEWNATIDRAKAKVDELTRDRTTRVRVDVDDRDALAAIAALREELDRLRNQPPIPIPIPPAAGGAGGSGGSGGVGLLLPAIAAGLTLVGPLTAAAFAGLTQVAGAAGVAGLGFVGLKNDMADGTAVGVQLTKQFHSIGTELTGLEQTAALALRAGVVGSLNEVQAELPKLTPLVRSLGSDLGTALNISTGALITGLEGVRPILDEAGQGAINLAQDFASFTESDRFHEFVSYASQELPKIEHDLADIGSAAINLAVALQPVGDALLNIVDDAVQVIDKVSQAAQAVDSFTQASNKVGQSSAAKADDKSQSFLDRSWNRLVTDFTSKDGFPAPGASKKKAPDTTGQFSATSADAQAVAASQAAALAAANTGLTKLESQYKLTVQQADALTQIVGVQSSQVTAGTVSLATYANALKTVETAENSASGAGSAFLASLATFSQSQGTAADRASLIGATLKAANGDLLSYSASQAQAATANQQFVTDFDNARFAAEKAHTAFNDAATGVVDLKTGSLNYHNAAAGPLIADLQQLQDAAAKAAGETYQHELATKGATKASADAVTQYQSQTAGSLVAEAKQLGLTSGQAQALADQYFGIKNIGAIKTLVETEGTDPVVTVLDKIGQQLSFLTGHAWNVAVTQSITVDTRQLAQPTGVGQQRTKKAGGGFITGPGPVGVDSVPILAAPGEHVDTVASTSRNAAALQAGNRGATLVALPGYASGGFVGVVAPTDPSIAAAAKAATASTATAKAAAAAGVSRANIDFTISADASKVLAAGTVSAIHTAVGTLIDAVHSGIAKGIGSNALVSSLQVDNNKIENLVTRRTTDLAKLATAQQKLASDQQQYAQEVSTVRSGVTGGFNLGSIASGLSGSFNPFGGSAAGVGAGGLISALQSQVGSQVSFNNGLISARGKGLNASLLQQLGEAGPSGAGSAVSALAGASKSQIAQINALYATSTRIGSSAGGLVAGGLFGSTLAADNRAVGAAGARVILDDKSVQALSQAVLTAVSHLGIEIKGTDQFSKVVQAEITKNNVALKAALVRR